VVSEGESIEVETPFGRFSAVARRGEDQEAKFFFRPHNVHLLADGEARAANVGRAQATAVQFLGESLDITACNGDTVINLRSSPSAHPTIGQHIIFSVDPKFCIAFVPELAGA